MKRYLLILTLILLSASSYAQKIRFTDRSNVWLYHITHFFPNEYGDYVTTYGNHDTMVHGYTYQQLNTHVILSSASSVLPYGVSSSTIYVREDTVSGIVYTLPYSMSGPDTMGQVWFNYNWQVGDTMFTYADLNPNGSYLSVIIDSIGSININGIAHRQWYYGIKRSDNTWACMFQNPADRNLFIEGIGCVTKFNPKGLVFCLDGYTNHLICFSNKGQFPPVNIPYQISPIGNTPQFINSAGCDLEVEHTSLNNVPIVIKPNPNNGKFSIVLPTSNERYCAVTVSNMMGQIVQQLSVPTGQTTEVHTEVPDGVYVLSMTIGDNNYNEKIELQR